MDFQSVFPVWDKLNKNQQNRIMGSLIEKSVKKGEIIHNGNMDCTGLFLIKSGQLRAYILSDEGRKLPYTVCLTEICVCFPRPV